MRKIGEPGVYRDVIDVLYPGETAHGQLDIPEPGESTSEVTWFIEPMPGWFGCRLRTMYRIKTFLHLPNAGAKLALAAEAHTSQLEGDDE